MSSRKGINKCLSGSHTNERFCENRTETNLVSNCTFNTIIVHSMSETSPQNCYPKNMLIRKK